MTAKHTQGKWIVNEVDQHTLLIVSDPPKLSVSVNSNLNFKREDLANAHLIAAAPDLLAALSAIVAIQPDTDALPPELFINALDAIAKAKGR